MGIEPTGLTFYVKPNGFEGRAEHQLKEHFPISRCIVPAHPLRLAPETPEQESKLLDVSPQHNLQI